MQAPTWMNLKGIMLSKRSSQPKGYALKDLEYSSGGLGLEEGENGEFLFDGFRVSVSARMEEFWGWMVVMLHNIGNLFNSSKMRTYKRLQ